jgi:transposase
LLARVAEVYREAHALGSNPTRTVAQRLGVARSTAGRYVVQARRQGHLGPAPGLRVAGEATEGAQR